MNLPTPLAMITLIATASAAPERLEPAQAEKFVKIALAGIDREYPNKPGEILLGPEDVAPQRKSHPVFYGHFDWHSSVHGHWMLLRLLRLHPDAPFAAELRRVLDGRLTREALATEAAYFRNREHRGFERMYGWAWALRLGMELRTWDDPDAKRWAGFFSPLETELVTLAKDYLPKLDWPIRCGFHPESSFALAQMLDWSRAFGDDAFEQLLVESGHYEGEHWLASFAVYLLTRTGR